MSTDEQLKGDSLRRQHDASRRFSENLGLYLAEDFDLKDIGVSAFKGANAASGALHRFLEAIRSKRIDPGSYLLVESLDRLSRQEARTAFSLFNEIIDAGIKIATLADGRVYEKGNTDFPELIYSLAVMSRAHDESRMKSQRGTAAWESKRVRVGSQKLTSLCPAWLFLSDDRSEFVVDTNRAKIVHSIFEDSATGIGNYSIARRLNQRGVRPFGRSRGWQTSYVNKILTNRAVIGEFQPHRLIDGRRTPQGSPIPGYFPTVVVEELFYRAQQARGKRRTGGAGRKGEFISNLFSGLATCAYCGSRMHFVNKGARPKGGTYLICDSANRGLGCKRAAWRYDDFESSFFAFVQEVDLEPLVRSESEAQMRADLEQGISSLEGRLHDLEQRRERIFELIGGDASPTVFVRDKLNQCEQELLQIETGLRGKRRRLDDLRSDAALFYESKDQIQALIARLQQRDGEQVYPLRAQIASKLRSVVAALVVGAAGTAPTTERTLALVRQTPETLGADEKGNAIRTGVIRVFEEELDGIRAHRRFFGVSFNDGRIRIVYPRDDNALAFEEQIVGDGRTLNRVETNHGKELFD